ncbi:MAG: class I SAM-dependent methyltransferase [Chromatiales bacterium]|jgi:predicted O-methyltransferase YrrM|nr:class I SAM-dependent methyltransferase [Chromatiales bacterium]
MTSKALGLDDSLQRYVLDVSLRETAVQRALREESDRHERAQMRTAADQAQFIALLLKLIDARRVLEIGTFTGYGSLTMAQALPADGHVITCDLNDEWTKTARKYWQQADVFHRIELRLGPALDTLDALLAAGESGRFDFAYIDADKTNMRTYYERCLKLVRAQGLIAIDNVLWGGSVINKADNDENTIAIRDFNASLHNDQRVDISLLPIGDGLTITRIR